MHLQFILAIMYKNHLIIVLSRVLDKNHLLICQKNVKRDHLKTLCEQHELFLKIIIDANK